MSAPSEHRGIVQRVADGRAIVAMESAGCHGCGQGGRMAVGRSATLLTLPAGEGVRVGDEVRIALPDSKLTAAALLGYLFPALVMIVGAWCGAVLDGSDGATALGAVVGFVGALGVARLTAGLLPDLLPAPRLIPLSPRISPPITAFPKE